MKTFSILFIAVMFVAPSLFAKKMTLREKRLNAKTTFQIDKSVISETAINETLSAEIKPEKTLSNPVSLSKTVRADRVDKQPVLKSVPVNKKRKATHLREWP